MPGIFFQKSESTPASKQLLVGEYLLMGPFKKYVGSKGEGEGSVKTNNAFKKCGFPIKKRTSGRGVEIG